MNSAPTSYDVQIIIFYFEYLDFFIQPRTNTSTVGTIFT